MNAQRLDMYGPIHKALRLFMSDTLAAVGRMDADDAAERVATLGQLRRLIDMMEHHAEAEDRFVHTAMESRRPGASLQRADEHRQQRAQLLGLGRLADAIEGKVAGRAVVAAQLYRELALIVAENFEHMNEEETLHNALLWAEFSDAELAAIQDQIVASIEPQAMAEVIRWMAPAMTPAERAMLFGNLQANAPAEAFRGLLEVARPHLAPRDWNKLVAAIAAPALAA